MGVPLVVTAVGELPRLLADGVDALVVRPDDPIALAEAVVRVSSDTVLRAQLEEASLARGELFDVARCTETVESIYLDLCGDRPGAPR